MTHFNVGDKGQRYEISVKMPNGEIIRIGWSNSPDGFKEAIRLHPSWNRGKIIVKGRRDTTKKD